ncbi:LIM and SH3 domain protein [Frankliniella fusca]|uniref:LIM and SH3 domain protein n=1 Tax=Frankliniella fusca TaxID=407009 RepID=A0AAE1I052_9NEOP|nr:LIM and SH3 domain protein [Frankliniella fusca]
MNKKCARCEKTVYPIEELKCLDKIWHKTCFKCKECGMALNMRNYKGFNKDPYCEAHVPKAKATTMADTPELKRIQENTKLQSNVKYHAEFEKAKGKFTQVADDPETLRIKQNSKIISNVAYHGDLEKKAVMEQKRVLTGENGEAQNDDAGGSVAEFSSHANHREEPPPVTHTQYSQPPQQQHQPAYHAPPSQPTHHVTQMSSGYGHVPPPHQPGKIADYDPLSGAPRNSPYSARQASTLIYSSGRGAVTSQPNRRIGSVADLDPVNDFYGSIATDYRSSNNNANHNNNHAASSGYPQTRHQAPVQQQYYQPPPQQYQPPPSRSGRVYRAMYDYEAQDRDEVSFRDGDMIVNCTPIDEGWMTGVVQRTGQSGMLPANYVELAHL